MILMLEGKLNKNRHQFIYTLMTKVVNNKEKEITNYFCIFLMSNYGYSCFTQCFFSFRMSLYRIANLCHHQLDS